MKLLLDIGNSAVKWALSADRTLGGAGRFIHRGADFAAQATLAWSDIARPHAIVAANVAGADLGSRLEAWTRRQWQQRPQFLVATREAVGVRNGYAAPQMLGIDRWAALVAAYAQYQSAVCVADCGTAITLDLVDTGGSHRGGLILAGIDLMQSALQGSTANLRATAVAHSTLLLATNTGDAIASGSVYAAAAAVERISQQMAAQCTRQPQLLLTGGDAQRVLPLLGVACQHDPDLVLKGLNLLSGDS